MVPSAGPRSVAVHSTVIFAMATCRACSCAMPAQHRGRSRQAICLLDKKPAELSATLCIPVCHECSTGRCIAACSRNG